MMRQYIICSIKVISPCHGPKCSSIIMKQTTPQVPRSQVQPCPRSKLQMKIKVSRINYGVFAY